MKLIVIILLSFITWCTPILLASSPVDLDDITIQYKDQALTFISGSIFTQNDFLMVPILELAKQISLNIEESPKTFTITNGSKTLIFYKKQDRVEVNQTPCFMPVKCMLSKGQYYVPLSYMAWYLGFTMHKKNNIYQISRLLNHINFIDNHLELAFQSKQSNIDGYFKKVSSNTYVLNLNSTVLSFLKSTTSNSIFNYIFIGQTGLNPDVVKLSISCERELEAVVSDNKILIRPIKLANTIKEITTTSLTTKKEDFLVAEGQRSSNKAIWIPSFKGVKDMKIKIKGKITELPGKAQIIDDDFLLPVEMLLTPFGYDYSADDQNNLIIKYGDQVEMQTSIPIHVIQGAPWVSVKKLSAKLGLGLRWDYRIHTLVINPIISEIAYIKKDNQSESILVKSYAELNPHELFQLTSPNRIVIDIPNAVLDVSKNIFPITSSNFVSIRAAQLTEEAVRVVVELRKQKSYAISLSDDGTNALIEPAGHIEGMRYKEMKDQAELIVSISSVVSFNITKTGKQYYLDFPDTFYDAKRLYWVSGRSIDKVEGMQYSWDPLVARVVLFTSVSEDVKVFLKKDTATIRFSKISGKQKGVALSKKKKAALQKKELPLLGKTIAIDPGHGGLDVGAIGFGGVYEKWYTLDISKKIRQRLSDFGATVIMLRDTDEYMTLQKRVQLANLNNADFFLSVHLNSHEHNEVHGSETYFYKDIDKLPCQEIHTAIVNNLKLTDKGVRKAHFFVLFHTNMPCVLIEPCYVSNQSEYLMLLSDDFRELIAKAAVEGIVSYFAKIKKQ